MADRLKGITLEINGDATGLSAALKGVNTEIKTTQTKLNDINRLLKFSPTSTELLTQKQKALKDAVDQTKAKLQELKDKEGDMKNALAAGKITQDQYDAYQREIVETQSKLENLEKQQSQFGSVMNQKIKAVGGKLQEYGTKVKAVGDKISDVGGKLTAGVTLPLVAVGAAGVKSFADVDKTMQLANKTMGNTAEQASMLNDAMKNAAANSTFGMNDAATASLNFARAGLSAEQAASSLAPAMNLAAGESGDLDTVSGGLVATINGFHGSFDEASKYADIFASACNNSALDVNSLSEAMSIAAPIFSSAGYSVKDASLYMGIMANAGIDANTAATSLKTGLARLVSPSKEGATAMEQLGINVTNADGSMKDSVTIQRELHDAFSKLSESEQIAAASAIFGKNQMAPWLSLINTAPDDVMNLNVSLIGASLSIDDLGKKLEGSGTSLDTMRSNMEALGISSDTFDYALKASGGSAEDFVDTLWEAADSGVKEQDVLNALGMSVNDLQSAMDSCNGTTQEMADTMMGGFGGGLEKLKSSLDVLIYNIGEALAPYIQKVVDFLQQLVDKFNALSPEQQDMIVKIAMVAAAIGPLLVIIGKIVSTVGMAMIGFGLFGSTLGTVGIVIGIVVGAIVGIIAIVKNWGKIMDWLKGVVSTVIDAIKGFFQGLFDKVSDIFKSMGDAISSAWDVITRVVKTAIMLIGSILQAAFEIITLPFRLIWENCKDEIMAAWNAISGAVKAALDAISNVIKTVWNAIKAFLDPILKAINTAISTAWNAIKTATTTVFNAVKAFITPIWNAIKTAITVPINAAKTAVSTAFNAIKTAATTVFNALKNTVTTIWNGIKTAITKPIEAARDAVKRVVDAIKGFFAGMHLSLPHIKLPHFSVTGKLSIDPPSVPHLSIDWYKKAMNTPYLLDGPTIFGMNGRGQLMGGGEAGKEVIMGLDYFKNHSQPTTINNSFVINGYNKDPEELYDYISDRMASDTNRRNAAWA